MTKWLNVETCNLSNNWSCVVVFCATGFAKRSYRGLLKGKKNYWSDCKCKVRQKKFDSSVVGVTCDNLSRWATTSNVQRHLGAVLAFHNCPEKNARLANTNSNANTRVASHLQVNRIDLFTLLTRASTIILLPSYREKEIFKHVLKLI